MRLCRQVFAPSAIVLSSSRGQADTHWQPRKRSGLPYNSGARRWSVCNSLRSSEKAWATTLSLMIRTRSPRTAAINGSPHISRQLSSSYDRQLPYANCFISRCLKYSVTRNYVIGLEVVLANGDVLRAGGRVHKNKTGFDLIGLFVGSEGMLGVVTEITLRLLSLPPARATLSAAFAAATQAAEAVQAIFAAGFLPSSLEIADRFTLEAARRDLGKMIVPEGNAHLLVDLDGQEESVRSESAAIRDLLEKRKPNTLEIATGQADCERLWALRRQFSNSLRATGLTKLNEDVVVPRSRLVDLMEFAELLQAKHGFPIACFGHAGDGNIHVNIMADRYNRDVAVRERVERALDDLFAQVLTWGGVITGEHGIGLAKKRWWPDATSEVARNLHRRLKQILDPNDILNPGKFV